MFYFAHVYLPLLLIGTVMKLLLRSVFGIAVQKAVEMTFITLCKDHVEMIQNSFGGNIVTDLFRLWILFSQYR